MNSKKHIHAVIKGSTLIFAIVWSLVFFSACSSSVKNGITNVDTLNRDSYVQWYKNLENSRNLALRAYEEAVSIGYEAGASEALCNLTFHAIQRMEYEKADSLLSIAHNYAPDNISNLCIEVLHMRLCQRRSLNKEFYLHKFQAERLISRTHNNLRSLTSRQLQRYTWARSEYGIVLSAYLFYVGRTEDSREALFAINDDKDIFLQSDTAQWLSYIYNVGAGGMLVDGTAEERKQIEFDNLMQCYLTSSHHGYIYWEANALQGMSQMLIDPATISVIKKSNDASLRYLNDQALPDSLLGKRLAERALDEFVRYGDIYQSSAAWRTLADAHFRIGDYESMLKCLYGAFMDTLIFQAPTIVSSVNERMCVAHSALNDKNMADMMRNNYLDIQDSTRQDRQLEARALSMDSKIVHLQYLIMVIIIVVMLLVVSVFLLIRYQKKNGMGQHISRILDRKEELEDDIRMLSLEISNARRLAVEQHAKVSMIQSMQPLIDRLRYASLRSANNSYDSDTIQYMNELCASVSAGNEALTKWIQLRRGNVKLHIETFPVQELFDIISLNTNSFLAKGITLDIQPSELYAKADKALTLFILNTLIDNARKFTTEGGTISVACVLDEEHEGYTVFTVTDSGQGMSQEQADHIFEYHVVDNTEEKDLSQQKSHGFGLMNCRGIIDSYRKSSSLFANSAISAKSEVGKGTSISFRLPAVIKLLLLLFTLTSFNAWASNNKISADNSNSRKEILKTAANYCDSMIYCNQTERYAECLAFADSCRLFLNKCYLIGSNNPNDTLTIDGGMELEWWKNHVEIDYGIILAMRNESAVAALALHEWDRYFNENDIYTSLYRESSADTTLDEYCRKMETYETIGDLAIIFLILVILATFYVFYRFYVLNVIVEKRDLRGKISELETAKQSLEAEHNRLYVANSIVENCLSTIKHETMYYPARISQLIAQISNQTDSDASADECTNLREIISFYANLYAILSSHCRKLQSDSLVTIEHVSIDRFLADNSTVVEKNCNLDEMGNTQLLINSDLAKYLLLILKKKNGAPLQLTSVDYADSKGCMEFVFRCNGIHLLDIQIAELFQIQTSDIDYLIIKQILREFGDRTMRYAAGIVQEKKDGVLEFKILLPCIGA